MGAQASSQEEIKKSQVIPQQIEDRLFDDFVVPRLKKRTPLDENQDEIISESSSVKKKKKQLAQTKPETPPVERQSSNQRPPSNKSLIKQVPVADPAPSPKLVQNETPPKVKEQKENPLLSKLTSAISKKKEQSQKPQKIKRLEGGSIQILESNINPLAPALQDYYPESQLNSEPPKNYTKPLDDNGLFFSVKEQIIQTCEMEYGRMLLAAKNETQSAIEIGQRVLVELLEDQQEYRRTEESILFMAENVRDRINRCKVNEMRIQDRKLQTIDQVHRNEQTINIVVQKLKGVPWDKHPSRREYFCKQFTDQIINQVQSVIDPNLSLIYSKQNDPSFPSNFKNQKVQPLSKLELLVDENGNQIFRKRRYHPSNGQQPLPMIVAPRQRQPPPVNTYPVQQFDQASYDPNQVIQGPAYDAPHLNFSGEPTGRPKVSNRSAQQLKNSQSPFERPQPNNDEFLLPSEPPRQPLQQYPRVQDLIPIHPKRLYLPPPPQNNADLEPQLIQYPDHQPQQYYEPPPQQSFPPNLIPIGVADPRIIELAMQQEKDIALLQHLKQRQSYQQEADLRELYRSYGIEIPMVLQSLPHNIPYPLIQQPKFQQGMVYPQQYYQTDINPYAMNPPFQEYYPPSQSDRQDPSSFLGK